MIGHEIVRQTRREREKKVGEEAGDGKGILRRERLDM
jgi:hypothetical protein